MKIVGEKEKDRKSIIQSKEPGLPFFYRTPDLVDYINGKSDLTTKSDVYQLGLVAAELFTGRNPQIRPENDDVLSNVQRENLKWIPGRISFTTNKSTNRNNVRTRSCNRPSASDSIKFLGWYFL